MTPEVRCLIGWLLDDGGIVMHRGTVSLADAVVYHAYGWTVLVDPADEVALATWERQRRPWNGPRWKWICYGD